MTRRTPSRPPVSNDRQMTEEEEQLWSRVTASVNAIGKKAHRLQASRKESSLTHDALRQSEPRVTEPDALERATSQRRHVISSLASSTKTGGSFDRRTARQLASGRLQIEAVLDLHGMRQREAHVALKVFLVQAQGRGFRHVKVITGKGVSRGVEVPLDRDRERGVLRRMVPHWLDEPNIRGLVVGYSLAGRGHGGEGALYVQLRKLRQ